MPRTTACCLLLICAAMAIPLRAQTFTTIWSFNGKDGTAPSGNLIQGIDGNIYGTTSGIDFCTGPSVSCGTIFKITPGGSLTTLYSFCSQPNCADGYSPVAGLALGGSGVFYGTTLSGGADGDYGTVFQITPGGTLTTLHSFMGTDGADPIAGLIQSANGEFYGATNVGGVGANCLLSVGCGTVFKVTPTGTLTTLYDFCTQANCTDGASPYPTLYEGASGDFYGTNYVYGAYGVGTVFRISPSGTLTTLYSFCAQPGCADGDDVFTGVVEDRNGDLYGTTEFGGDSHPCPDGGSGGCGTIFQLTLEGTLTTLHKFQNTDGAGPNTLVIGTDGNFYGTTGGGGTSTNCPGGCGTIFKMTPSGTLTTLYNFCALSACPDGKAPDAALFQATDGKFYGTTEQGGISSGDCFNDSCGTVFSLDVGLGPFIRALPTSGTVGSGVKILGTNLTGATSVTFNGIPAAFTVERASEITTTVPTGATTGDIQVVTPNGALSSNVSFQVRPL